MQYPQLGHQTYDGNTVISSDWGGSRHIKVGKHRKNCETALSVGRSARWVWSFLTHVMVLARAMVLACVMELAHVMVLVCVMELAHGMVLAHVIVLGCVMVLAHVME